MLTSFDSHIQGIPCHIVVDSYRPGTPAQVSGPPEHCYPAEGSEAEYRVTDRRGYPAPWLQAKIKQEDEERILEQIDDEMDAASGPPEV